MLIQQDCQHAFTAGNLPPLVKQVSSSTNPALRCISLLTPGLGIIDRCLAHSLTQHGRETVSDGQAGVVRDPPSPPADWTAVGSSGGVCVCVLYCCICCQGLQSLWASLGLVFLHLSISLSFALSLALSPSLHVSPSLSPPSMPQYELFRWFTVYGYEPLHHQTSLCLHPRWECLSFKHLSPLFLSAGLSPSLRP